MAIIDASRSLQQLPNVTSSEALIDICSAVDASLKKFLGRDIEAANYDELYTTRTADLTLKQYPTIKISSVRCNPVPALIVSNTSAANSVATVEITTTSLVLSRIASGVTTSNTLLYATYVTIAELATAITAVGNGWSASVGSSLDTWASSDLGVFSGTTHEARNASAQLLIFNRYIGGYRLKADRGIVEFNPYGNVGAPVRNGLLRVAYRAGYETVPEELVQVAAEMVALCYKARFLNANLASENLGMYSYTILVQNSLNQLSLPSQQALQLHRSFRLFQ